MANYKGFLERSSAISRKVLGKLETNKPFFIGTGPNTESLLESGAAVTLDKGMFDSDVPKLRRDVNLTPNAVILVKKKAFSTLSVSNDLRWMDKSEKFLLRATKALFAYKVQQLRAYESLSKFENFYEQYQVDSLDLLYSALTELNKLSFDRLALYEQPNRTRVVNSTKDVILPQGSRGINVETRVNEYDLNFKRFLSLIGEAKNAQNVDGVRTDLVELLKRNAFSIENKLTTWIVDPNDISNYATGPGTGVIELGMFTGFNSSIGLDSNPKSGSFSVYDPYNIGTILEDDIEFAIEEAFYGTFNLFKGLIDGSSKLKNEFGQYAPINSSELASIAAQAVGLGGLDKSFDIDFVRERLRTFYLGKPMVNPADGINIFVSSSKNTNEYSDESATSAIIEGENEISEIVLEAERKLYTSGKISLKDFKNIRSLQDSSFNMIHVFGGYVKNVNTDYNQGAYTLKVSCSDNMGWLSWSRYAQVPALQDYLGPLEDPLTPFVFKSDELGNIIYPEGYELLEENKILLKNGLLSYNSGLFRGQGASESNIFQGEFNDFGSLKGQKVLQHPDGFIYRWKNGILSVVADIQTADPTGNAQRQTKVFARKYGISAVGDILTNLDVANILSILITGQPYNTDTFLQRAFEAHNLSGTNSALNPYDPLTTVIQSLKKQNFYYGNFKPYRTITLNSRTVQKQIQDQLLKRSLNNNVQALQRRKFTILEQIRKIDSRSNNPVLNASNNVLKGTLEQEIINIERAISEQVTEAKNSGVLSSEDALKLNVNFFDRNKGLELDEDPVRNEDVTRAMMKVGQIRRIEDVRLNRDRNLFVVSDEYDYNTDLRPFLLKIKNSRFNLFASQYTDTFSSCNAANKQINFEFFCNSQGHIEFRPPGWNKTPLSVLLDMLANQSKTGRKVVPKFLTTIFQNRINAIQQEIQTLNISIVLSSLLLGRFPDKNLIPGLTTAGVSSLNFFGVKTRSKGRNQDDAARLGLIGASLPNSQRFGKTAKFDLDVDVTLGEGGKTIVGDTETLLGDFDVVFQEKLGLLNKVLKTVADPTNVPAQKYATSTNLNSIRNEFFDKTGIDAATRLGVKDREFNDSDFLFNSTNTQNPSEYENTGELYKKLLSNDGLLNKITQFVSERDRLVTILQRNKEKEEELEEVEMILGGNREPETNEVLTYNDSANNFLDNFQQTLQNASDGIGRRVEYLNYLNQTAYKGSVYDHLIEDDTSNILGFGSGKRFIIEDEVIISASYNEVPPKFTRVNIKGDAPMDLGQKFASFSDGLYFFAGATDFDLWRQYGYVSTEMSVPFLSDSELQCKPYAIFQLQMARANINQANLTVVGNEFYQPGDVVFVRSKNLLYYVVSVSHSFSFGSSFTSTLTLNYGHPPGEYLPSPLDIIGQQLSTDPLKDKILNYRSDRGDDEYRPLQPHASILLPRKSGGGVNTNKDDILTFKDNQARFNTMMIDLSTGLVSGSKYLLLRAFVNSEPESGDAAISLAEEILFSVQELFTNPEMVETVNDDEVAVGENLNFSGIIQDGISVADSLLPIKKRKPLILPNSIQPPAIDKSQILLQISFLKKSKKSSSSSSSTGEEAADLNSTDEFAVAARSSESQTNNDSANSEDLIVCLNNKLADIILDADGKIKNKNQEFSLGSANADAKSLLPAGGPHQTTWLDLRDLYGFAISGLGRNSVARIVEVGVIDLTKAIKRG